MSAAALPDKFLECLGALLEDPSVRSAATASMARDVKEECPPPWSVAYCVQLATHVAWEPKACAQPDWAKPIIAERELFAGSVLLLLDPDGNEHPYKVVYAVKSPFYLALTPLRGEHVDLSAGEGPAFRDRALRRWRCNFAKHESAADVPGHLRAPVWFLPQARYEGGVSVSATLEPMPIQFWLRGEATFADDDEDELEGRVRKSKSVDDLEHDKLLQ